MSYQSRNAYRAARKGNFECDNVADDGVERGEVVTERSHRAAGGIGFNTVEVWRQFCEVNNIENDYAHEYGEPGYGSTETKGVLLSNWNRIPKKLAKRLEAQGYGCEYSDEWMVDHKAIDSDTQARTSKVYRTQPDSHGWEPRIRLPVDGCEYLTPDSEAQEWIDDSLNERRPLPRWFDESELTTRGFAVLDQADKEVGFHPGQDETPDKFMPALIEQGFDVVLQITDRSQFDVRYKVWTRRVEG